MRRTHPLLLHQLGQGERRSGPPSAAPPHHGVDHERLRPLGDAEGDARRAVGIHHHRPVAAALGEELGDRLRRVGVPRDRVQLGAEAAERALLGDEHHQLLVFGLARHTGGVEEVHDHPAALAAGEVERVAVGSDGPHRRRRPPEEGALDDALFVGGVGLARGKHPEQGTEHEGHRERDERGHAGGGAPR
jgi:hypothetical protein